MQLNEEFRLCAQDFTRFIKYWCMTDHGFAINYNNHKYLERLIAYYENNDRIIYTKFRRGGFTTFTVLYMLWRCMFKLDQNIYYFCMNSAEVLRAMSIINIARNNFPEWLKPELVNTQYFSETNSQIHFCINADIKMQNPTCVVIDEAVYIPNLGYLWDYIQLFDTKCIIFSSPSGKANWFYNMYQNATSMGFHVYKNSHKENLKYDEKWEQEIKRDIGLKYQQEILQEFI